MAIPSRDEMVRLTAAHMYGGRILNNAHRGDVVEAMVIAALGDDWRFVGLGWHPWDLQRGSGAHRMRIQVKQTAAVQLWGNTIKRSVSFAWKSKSPSYFERDNPGESIESEGYFCELFVVGVHDETDRDLIDQADPAQWWFMVIPSAELRPGIGSMVLSKVRESWHPVPWASLADKVAEQTRIRA